MSYTISKLSESIANSLTATLRGVSPVLDSMGRPCVRHIRGGSVWNVWCEGRHALLCCSSDGDQSLRKWCGRYAELSTLAPESFVPFTLHEDELMVFDACGQAVRIAVAVFPNPGVCMPVDEFVIYATEVDNQSALRAALHSLVRLIAAAEQHRERLDVGVRFGPSGRLVVCEVGRNHPRLTEVALVLAWALCRAEGESVPPHRELTGGLTELRKTLKMEHASEGETCAILWDYCRVDPRGLGMVLRMHFAPANSSEPQSSSSVLRRFAECEGVSLVETADGFIYIDSAGNQLNNSPFLSAEPMREGRAEVRTAEGWGLLSADGEWIVEPCYEELVWNETLNSCVVMRDGRWELLDRMGEPLTSRWYDWIGEPSEGLFPVELEGRSGCIDAAGHEVATLQTTFD